MFKAVIFDFDGVVVDSEPLHLQAFNQSLESYGVKITEKKYYTDYAGYTDVECFLAISRDFDMGLKGDEVVELARRKTEFFDKLADQNTAIIDGVAEFIDMLKENHIRMAVCSGAILSDIELMLKGTSLINSFETIVTADDVEKGKPEPEGFLLALKQLNEMADGAILPGECVVVEDSRWGLAAAGAAGMKKIGVTNTYSVKELTKYSDKVVDGLGELTIDDLKKLCDT